ncbi:MAG: hypothetical protein HJJLKODD_02646 [Phycisphaerae bacterium]|nr:hypothetical protein [Phycisphaerae bacterium]
MKNDFLVLLAQAESTTGTTGQSGSTAPGTATQPGASAQPPSIFNPITGLMFALVLFWVVMVMGDRKRRKQAANMLGQMKKNDRVLTIGGIMGTIVSVKDDEIVVRVDETNNTKITFSRKAIQQVLSPSAPEGTNN